MPARVAQHAAHHELRPGNDRSAQMHAQGIDQIDCHGRTQINDTGSARTGDVIGRNHRHEPVDTQPPWLLVAGRQTRRVTGADHEFAAESGFAATSGRQQPVQPHTRDARRDHPRNTAGGEQLAFQVTRRKAGMLHGLLPAQPLPTQHRPFDTGIAISTSSTLMGCSS